MPITLSTWIARVSLAFCFLSFGVWELIDPSFWSGYVPSFVADLAPVNTLVLVHGASLCVVALGVLSGKWAKVWTTLAALMLLEVTLPILLDEGFSPTFIRDAALTGFAAALAAQSWLKKGA
jgi:hypothetical protein